MLLHFLLVTGGYSQSPAVSHPFHDRLSSPRPSWASLL